MTPSPVFPWSRLHAGRQILFLLSVLQTCFSAPVQPFHPSKIQHFLRSKCQRNHHNNPLQNSQSSTTSTSANSCSLWAYEGRLVDPNNNQIIANVEGLEVVRNLSECYPYGKKDRKSEYWLDREIWYAWRRLRGLRRLGDLKIRDVLSTNSNNGQGATGGEGSMDEAKLWDYAGTVLSRKLFCYKAPYSNELLKEYRIRPTSPARKIKKEEAIALYDTATSYVSTRGGQEMEIITEWPDGRWVQSSATSSLSKSVSQMDLDDINSVQQDDTSRKKKVGRIKEGSTIFEYTAYAKRSPVSKSPCLKPLSPAPVKGGKGVSISPPRSKLIQFGRDEDSENRRYGARETYSYTIGTQATKAARVEKFFKNMIHNIGYHVRWYDFNPLDDFSDDDGYVFNDSSPLSCTVRYTRYGEAPPWYGPGRMCTLELWGRRINSVLDAPPLAARVAATHVPGFLSVYTPIPIGPSYQESGYDGATSSNLKNERFMFGKKKISQMIATQRKNKRPFKPDTKVMKRQQSADLAAVKAVDFFRGRSDALPLKIVHDDDDDIKGQKGMLCSMKKAGVKAVKEGITFVERVCDASFISSTAESAF